MDITDFHWKLKREGGTLHSSCRLPHVIHTAKPYPIPAPNGSTVVVYGHTNGLRVLWVGGRAFKQPPPPPPEKPQKKPNSRGRVDEDVVMIIDSDDEDEPALSSGPAPPHPVAPPGFEDREEEYDPSNPVPSVLQCLDLLPGLDVLQISFPPLSSNALSLVASPLIASKHMVLAAACSDYLVRLITLPLLPPSPDEKRYMEAFAEPISASRTAGPFGEQVLTLIRQPGLVGVPAAVAVTITPKDTCLEARDAKADGEADRNFDETNTGGAQSSLDLRRSQGAAHSVQLQKYEDWDIVVATLYGSGSPCLAFHRIPISTAAPDSSLDFSLPTAPANIASIEILASPALRLAFNPALYPARHHSYLLITDSIGCVRMYDYRWRASEATPSTSPAHGEATKPESGPWLLTLYPSFAGTSTSATAFGIARRKGVVDAKWAMGGKAVVALLSDGEWGVWDIHGAGPGVKRTGGLLRDLSRNAIRGGALTPFSLSGRIDDGGAPNNPARSAHRKADEPPNLVPRTPRTRKVQEQMLFGPPTPAQHQGRPPQGGGIAVVQSLYDTAAAAAAAASHEPRRHETLVFWLDDKLAVLPDLWAYWEDQIAKTAAAGGGGLGNLLDADPCRGLVRLDGLARTGDIVCSVDVSPRRLQPTAAAAAQRKSPGASADGQLVPDILVAKGRHLVVLSGADAKSNGVRRAPEEDEQAAADSAISGFPQLMGSRELSLDEIDLVVSRMERQPKAIMGNPNRRRVAFAAGI